MLQRILLNSWLTNVSEQLNCPLKDRSEVNHFPREIFQTYFVVVFFYLHVSEPMKSKMRFIRLHTLAFEDILVFGTGPAEIFAEEVSFFIQRFCKLQPDAFACFSFQAERYPSGDVLSGSL